MLRKKASPARKTPAHVKKAVKRAKKVQNRIERDAYSDGDDSDPLLQREMEGIDGQQIDLLPNGLMQDTILNLKSLMEDFREVSENYLNRIQRRRKIGAGIRNYGFIEKVADLAAANPQFAQFFRTQDLRNCITNFDVCRDIAILLQSFTRLVTNTMLVYSDEAYGMSLIFYNNVKELSRRGNPTAMELFRTLQPFFKRTRRDTGTLTEKETMREEKALLHGKKDGRLIIENISPKLTGGEIKQTI